MGSENRLSAKERISVVSKYDAFYTGGGVQITQDGHFMLCCYGDSVKVVDVASGKIEATIGGKENNELTSFALADDDRTLVVAAKNGILVQWDFKERTEMKSWKSAHVGPVSCMAFDSTSTLLASGGTDSTIKVWDIVRKYYTHNLRGAQGVFSIVRFYQNQSGLTVFGAADDYKIRAWSLDSSQCIAVLEGHYSTVTSLQFCESKNTMMSGGRDKVVLLWSLVDFSLLKTIPVYESIEAVILIPEKRSLPELNVQNEGITFVTASSKGALKVWDGATGRCIHSQEDVMTSVSEDDEETEEIITTQAFYNEALDAISVVTSEHNIIIYRLEDFSLVKQFVGYNNEVLDIKVMGKNQTHLAVATNSPLIRVYEISTFACQLLEGHKHIVVALDVFPKDRNMLVSGSKDHSVLVWRMDPDSGKVHWICRGYGHTGHISAVACCWNKPSFFISASDDKTLKVWDIPAKKPVVALKLNLSPRFTVEAHVKAINSISVSANNKLVATGSQDHTAKVWNAADLTLIGTMTGHKKGVMCVQFSPVDLVLATSSKDGTIRLWSLKNFDVLKTLEDRNLFAVQKIIFLSEGTQILSSSCDGALRLWNINKVECVQTAIEHTGEVWALTCTAKEDTIISGGADSNIIVWKDVTEEKRKEEFAMHKNQVLSEQHLSNLIHEKKWVEALGLSITLEQPFMTLRIVDAILQQEEDGISKLHESIAKLETNQIESLLKYTVEWNTISKRGLTAALILSSVFTIKSPEELKNFQDIKQIARSLQHYTERHYQRSCREYTQVQISDILVRNVKVAAEDVEDMDAH